MKIIYKKILSKICKLFLLGFFSSIGISNAQIIESALDDSGTFCYVVEGGGAISTVNSPVRGGDVAFKHSASTNFKRSEIDDCSFHRYDAKGNIFWYGSSFYLPEDSFSDDITTYVMQMRFSNLVEGNASEQNCTTRACEQSGNEAGSGHHLRVVNGRWEFTLRFQDPDCDLCKGTLQERFDLGAITIDEWTDFIFEANWNHTEEGYLKVWKQVDTGGYELVVDYNGRTWYDKYADGSNRQGQDVKAPNYTVGLYFSNKTDIRTMYTDEIRVYQQKPGGNGFEIVRPDQNMNNKAYAPNPVSGSTAQVVNPELKWFNTSGTLSNEVYFGTSESPEKVATQTETTFKPNVLDYSTTYYWKINEVKSEEITEGNVWSFTTQNQPAPCDGVIPVSITASTFQEPNSPDLVMDCNLISRWAANGQGEYITFEIDHPYTINGIRSAWFSGNQRRYRFDILASTDGVRWFTVLRNQQSGGTTLELETFNFAPVSAKYIRYVGFGSTANNFNSITEFEIISSGLEAIPASGVSIKESNMIVNIGQGRPLTPLFEPLNASDKTVIWSSSNSQVATVNENGIVTGINLGTSEITVTSADGGFTATTEITVQERGASGNLLINGDMEDGTTGWRGNVTTITSAMEERQEGLSSLSITARGGNWAGPEQNIMSILESEGPGDYYASAFVKMKTGEMNARITIKLRVNNSWSFIILGGGAVNSEEWNEFEGTTRVNWSGTIQEAWIYVEGNNSGDYWLDDVWLVSGKSKDRMLAVDGISLDSDALELETGNTQQLIATVSPVNASNKTIIWSSTEPDIAWVNENGLVLALLQGVAEIKAETIDGGFIASTIVTVSEATSPSNIALKKPITASSFQNDDSGIFAPENLVDGDISDISRWSVEGYPQWAEIDLGENYDISIFELITFQNRAYRYTIEVKADDGAYQTIVHRSENVDGNLLIDEVSITGRYVKITVSGASGYNGPWISLNELKVFGIKTKDNSSKYNLDQFLPVPKVFPNPVNSRGVTIQFPEEAIVGPISIFNPRGEEMIIKSIIDGNEVLILRETFSRPGIYILIIGDGVPIRLLVR